MQVLLDLFWELKRNISREQIYLTSLTNDDFIDCFCLKLHERYVLTQRGKNKKKLRYCVTYFFSADVFLAVRR